MALDVAPSGISLRDLEKQVAGKMVAHKGFREFAKNMFIEWQKMLASGEAHGILKWGGNWQNFIDLPHWEVRR